MLYAKGNSDTATLIGMHISTFLFLFLFHMYRTNGLVYFTMQLQSTNGMTGSALMDHLKQQRMENFCIKFISQQFHQQPLWLPLVLIYGIPRMWFPTPLMSNLVISGYKLFLFISDGVVPTRWVYAILYIKTLKSRDFWF